MWIFLWHSHLNSAWKHCTCVLLSFTCCNIFAVLYTGLVLTRFGAHFTMQYQLDVLFEAWACSYWYLQYQWCPGDQFLSCWGSCTFCVSQLLLPLHSQSLANWHFHTAFYSLRIVQADDFKKKAQWLHFRIWTTFVLLFVGMCTNWFWVHLYRNTSKLSYPPVLKIV